MPVLIDNRYNNNDHNINNKIVNIKNYHTKNKLLFGH